MSERQDYLVVEVQVMVPLGPNSEAEWPEERCAQRYREVVDEINDRYAINIAAGDWWVTTA